MATTNYPGFGYEANQLVKFLAASDIFAIMLKDGKVIHHIAEDKDSFREWLLQNNIEDIKAKDDWNGGKK